MPYPNDDYWKALADGEEIQVNEKPYLLSVVDCGDLVMPTGLLAMCDPFSEMQVSGNPALQLSPGKYPVKVTLADVSGLKDGSHLRAAYASLVLSGQPEVTRRQMPLLNMTYHAFSVDAGLACFVDEGALATAMPPEKEWEEIFEDGLEACWIKRVDDLAHIRAGLANIVLPQARHGENIILFYSGWGDGSYGVVGSFDRQDNLTAVHIDFKVVQGPVIHTLDDNPWGKKFQALMDGLNSGKCTQAEFMSKHQELMVEMQAQVEQLKAADSRTR